MFATRPEHFHAALVELAATNGNVSAILAPSRAPLTFARLLARVEEIKQTLNAFGIGCGDRVVAALPADADTAVCFFAVAACATYVPLNPEYTEDEFARYFARLRPKAVIATEGSGPAIRSAAGQLRIPLIELVTSATAAAGTFELRSNAASECADPRWATGDDVGLILLTSGSTDRPKLVPVKHRYLTAAARALKAHFNLDRQDRYLHTMPMFHGHGLRNGLTLPVLAGSGVICARGFEVASFFRNMATMGATWYSAGYTLQQAIFDRVHDFRGVAESSGLRFAVSASGPINPRVARGLEAAFGVPLLNRYSSSETGTMTCESLPPGSRRPGTAGKAVFNEVRVVDAHGVPLGANEEGEIVTRGPSVMDGYLDDPQLNERSFVDGWFRTGDAGRLDEDGYLTITGRIKELINRGGEKIAPTEVEHIIGEHPGVDRICVFGIPHPSLGEEVAAAVVPVRNAIASERSIITFAQKHLAPFKVPRRVVFTDELPTNTIGKTDRRACARLYATMRDRPESEATSFAGPEFGVESEVAALWRSILNATTVRHDTDFFLSGGDSLKITELLVAIQQRFGVCISMRETLEEGATVAAIARLITCAPIEMRRAGALPDGLMPLKADGERPPLFAIPATDGNPGGYVHFCQLLDEVQPLYGLMSRGLDGRSEPLDRVETIAADHIARIRALQPAGPYHLIGACFGGRVAYEVARQLDAAGERIAFLALLDPSPPFTNSDGGPRGEPAARAEGRRQWQLARFVAGRARLYAHELARLDGPARRNFLKAKLNMAREIVLRRDLFRGDRTELNARAVYEANRIAGRRYVPQPYSGAAILVLTDGGVTVRKMNHRFDWLQLLPQAGAPRFVPGRDSGDMLIPPNVYTLAARINNWLDVVHGDLRREAAPAGPREPGNMRAPSAKAGERA